MCTKQNIPDPNRPIMMLRFRLGQEDPALWKRTFEQLKRCREACDEVWFSTGVGFPSLTEHRRHSDMIGACAEDLRSIGIIPSLQFQTTIGHGDSLIELYGAEGKTWTSYVGVHGEQCKYINCPRQPGFLDYLYQVSGIYAQWNPGSVWIDDDLRLHNHWPAMDPMGCYCPDCLALFGKEEGRSFTREELVEAYSADPELFERWKSFGIRSLNGIAEQIVKGFHSVSPQTRFGLQHCSSMIRLDVMDSLKKYSGMKVGSRPGGGAYSDHEPYALINKALSCAEQQSCQQEYETLFQCCPEIENYPRTMCCKTPQGHRVESLLHLSAGLDSLSYFCMDPLLETPEWYGKELLEPLAADAPSYREYLNHNQDSFPGGVGVVGNWNIYSSSQWSLVGVPLAFYSPKSACKMIAENSIEELSDDELTAICRGDIILDGKAVAALQKRGLEKLICGIKTSMLSKSVYDYYTDDPLNSGLTAGHHTPPSDQRYVFDIQANCNVRILSSYRDLKKNDLGAATVLVERADGTRIALIGNDGYFTKFLSSSRITFINRIADWVSHETLPAMTKVPAQCLLVPRVTENGILRSITVLNVTICRTESIELQLRGVPKTVHEIEWNVPSKKPVSIPVNRQGDIVSVTLSSMEGWEIGWLKIPAK